MDSAYIPIIAGISIGIFLIATATPKEQPKKAEPKKEKNASKGKGKAKEVKPKFTAEEEEKHFSEILKQLDSGSNVDYTALVKKIDDEDLRAKVLMRVRNHYDPRGSERGKKLRFSEDGESKEEADFNEVMDGLGNKCIKKIIESMVLSGVIMAGLYASGQLDGALTWLNSNL